MSQGRSRRSRLAFGATALIAGVALIAAACGGSTSDKDKTATAAAKGGTTPATSAATKVAGATSAATSAATAAATKSAATPAAGATGKATVNVADTAIGKDTTHSIQSGVMFGYAGAIDALVGRISGELGSKPKVIATGGLGGVFTELCESIESYDEMLTLDGIKMFAQNI